MPDVADELRRILDAKDGRTLIEMRESERHYDVVIEKAEYEGEATTVHFDDGWVTTLSGPEVKAGDTVTFWDDGFGTQRHGWALNGELVEWLTPYERIARRVTWLAEQDRRDRERLERGAEKRAAEYDALPDVLKLRLDRFASERADFWVSGGDYEMFCCTEAVKIADHLRPRVEAGEDPETVVREFHGLPWDEQAKVVSDQHSGNTFGGACSLARAVLAGESV